MDPITPRNRNRPVAADVYWRRRLFALAAGLAVFGLLAWAVGGATTTRQTASTTSLTSQSPQASVTPVSAPPASPSPSPSTTGPSPSPSATGTPGGHGKKPAAKAGQAGQAAKTGRAHARHAAAAAQARPHGSGCPAGDVVITMTASSNSYGARARPELSVDLVSTDSRTCTLNTGSRHLAVVIESGGVRVWGSADCGGKSGASVTTKLKRGVPVQLRFSWDRLLSAPGCRGARSPARPGTYTVTASDGALRSRTLAFVLR
jgi:hypothetical protein